MPSSAAATSPFPSPLQPAGQVGPSGSTAVAFDDDGFLIDGARWTRDLAQALAREAGIDSLSPAHWQLIGVVRARYHQLGSLPVMRRVCRAAGIEPGSAQRLFSGCRSLWRIAGLPNPGAEAIAYMH